MPNSHISQLAQLVAFALYSGVCKFDNWVYQLSVTGETVNTDYRFINA